MQENIIKLGLMAPLSGVASLNSEEIIQAAELACHYTNQHILTTHQLQLQIEDDGSMPHYAVPAAKKLIKEGAIALLGNVMSNARLAVMHRVCEPLRIPYLNYSFYEGSILSPYFFNYAALPNQQIQPAMGYIAKNHGYKGYFAGSNFEWSRGSICAATHSLKALGGEVVGEDYFDFDVSSFTTLIESISTSGANFFVSYFAPEDQIKLLEQLSYSKVFHKVAIISGYFDEVIAASLSPDIRENIYAVNSYFMNQMGTDNHPFLAQLEQAHPTRKLWPGGDLFATSHGATIYTAITALGNALAQCESCSTDELMAKLTQVQTTSPLGHVKLNADTQHATLTTHLAKCNDQGVFNIIESYHDIKPVIAERYSERDEPLPMRDELIHANAETLNSKQFELALESIEPGLFICDSDGYIVWANQQLGLLFNYKPHELIGQPFHRMLISPRFWSKHQQHFQNYVNNTADDEPRTTIAQNVLGYRKNGTEFPAKVHIGKSSTPQGLLITASITDISQEKAKQESMMWAATHDGLTKLPNRQLFKKRLQKALERNRTQAKKLALIFIDLDNFKLVNDTYGHELGDKLLIIIADILLHATRPGDTVARFGGDEFVILCDQISNDDELADIAKSILDALHQPMTLKNIEYIATASIGIAFNEHLDTTAEDLLRNADVAMYQAKERGRDQWIFFQDSMYSNTKQKLYIAMGLHDALKNDEFHMLIQPAYQLNPFKLKGGEALIRWVHKGEFISPVDFIPLAETNGFIYDIGLWVFKQCCKVQARWQQQFNNQALEYLSVNLSPRQLSDPRLLEDFKQALQENNAKPEWFLLEITETAIMEDAHQDLKILHQLKALGFNIAIDDFGTGYSSFSQLVNLPLDILKIDRCFVTPLKENESSRTLAKMIIDLAHNLGSKVIAEGVEDDYHEAFLIQHHCEAAQGYKYSKPISIDEFEQLLAGPP